MRRRGITFFHVIGVLGLTGVGAVVLIPFFARPYDGGDRVPACFSNIRQLTMGMQQYVQDADGRLPPRTKWADSLFPYVKANYAFHCPLAPKGDEVTVSFTNSAIAFTDYWYNVNLSTAKLSHLHNFVFALGEGNDGLDSNDCSYVKDRLDSDWLTDRTKPSFRHQDGANYSFMDGHAKWLKPSDVVVNPAKKSLWTFSIK